jgi:hypothetical protein
LKRFRERAEDAASILRDVADRRHAAVLALQRARDYRDRVAATPTGGGRGGTVISSWIAGHPRPDDRIVEHRFPDQAAAARQLADAEREFEAAHAEIAALDARVAAAKVPPTADRLTRWLRDEAPPDAVFEEYRGTFQTKIRATPGEIDKLRNRIAELRADLHEVKSSPYPLRVACATIRRQIEELAARGQPDVLRTIELNRPVAFRHTLIREPGIAFEVPDTLALFAWVHKDALLQKLETELAELADSDADALDDEQRVERERRILAEILDIERAEERAIELCESDGLHIERRGDADPLAVLGITMEE